MTNQTPTQAAKAYFDAWNIHDVDAVLATFTTDGTFWDNQMSEPVQTSTLKDAFQGLLDGTKNLRFEVSDIAETTKGSAVAEWVMKGSNANGDAFAVPGIDVFDVTAGRISAARAYMNPAQLG